MTYRGETFRDTVEMPMGAVDYEYCVDRDAELDAAMAPLKAEKKQLKKNIKTKHMPKEVECFYLMDPDEGYKTKYATNPLTGEVIEFGKIPMEQHDYSDPIPFPKQPKARA